MKICRRILLGIAALLIAVTYWLWHPLAQTPSYLELSQQAQNYDVEVIRDSWGVPHIYGMRNADVAFAVAYVNAEDDLETVMETIAATRGVLARYRGNEATVSDYLVAWMLSLIHI